MAPNCKRVCKLRWTKINFYREARELADKHSIPSKSIIKISHRISHGIIDAAEEENCNFILTGRKKRSTLGHRIFSSVMDHVLQEATHDAAILHGEIKSAEVRRILIPFSGDIHTEFAAEMTPALVEFFGAKITVGIVFNPDTTLEQRQQQIDQMNDLIAGSELSAEIETVVNSDILQGVIRLSANCDLLVMGGKARDYVELFFAKSLVTEITEQVTCPVLWLKKYEEKASLLSSLFKKQIN